MRAAPCRFADAMRRGNVDRITHEKANEVAEDQAGAHNTHSAIASSLARTAPGGGNGSPKVHTERTSIISASLKPMQSSHTIA